MGGRQRGVVVGIGEGVQVQTWGFFCWLGLFSMRYFGARGYFLGIVWHGVTAVLACFLLVTAVGSAKLASCLRLLLLWSLNANPFNGLLNSFLSLPSA